LHVPRLAQRYRCRADHTLCRARTAHRRIGDARISDVGERQRSRRTQDAPPLRRRTHCGRALERTARDRYSQNVFGAL
jgi:hypothetical protein